MGANGVFEEKHVVSRTHVVPCLDRFFLFLVDNVEFGGTQGCGDGMRKSHD